MSDRLPPNTELRNGAELLSANKKAKLILQTDGNLVLYRNDETYRPLWSTGTWGKPVVRAIMQVDGNFVCYDGSNKPLWSSKTYGHPGASLQLQDDGNLVISIGARPLWASNTAQNWNRPASRLFVEIKTADESMAGTDSNIFLIAFGERGRTDEFRLNPLIHRNAFERNSLEKIYLDALPNLGRIFKISVRSDCSYPASDWRLNWVRVSPSYPEYPTSTFSYHQWINNTKVREILADDWPWEIRYSGATSETSVARKITAIDLLDSTEKLAQDYTVTYVLSDQVQVSEDIKEASKLSAKVTWKAPDSWTSVIGQFGAELSEEWAQEIQTHRVSQSTQSLTTIDKRSMVFPPGHLTLVQTDWTEIWTKALATIGSTSVGMRWLNAVPANPSWTVKSFAPKARIPRPFSDWVRENRPDISNRFTLD